MTTSALKTLTHKELETMAKRLNVPGRHTMKKEELIKILVFARRKKKNNKTSERKANNGVSAANLKSKTTQGSNGQASSNRKNTAKNGQSVKSPVGKPHRLISSEKSKNGSSPEGSQDRLTVQVLDAHWLHAVWSLSQGILDRARTALGVEWHQAVPIIRVLNLCEEEESSGATIWVKDIEIHGNVDHWYVPVESPPCTYTLQIGYRTAGENFFSLAHYNKVTTPEENSTAITERNQNGNQSSRNNDSKHTGCFGNTGEFGNEEQHPMRENDPYSDLHL
jgi:hypothetical protein